MQEKCVDPHTISILRFKFIRTPRLFSRFSYRHELCWKMSKLLGLDTIQRNIIIGKKYCGQNYMTKKCLILIPTGGNRWCCRLLQDVQKIEMCVHEASAKFHWLSNARADPEGGDWGDRPSKTCESIFFRNKFVKFGKHHSQKKDILSFIVLSQKCCDCEVYFISLTVAKLL